MFRDNLFPSASPSLSLPSLLALPPTFFSPRGQPHLLFSGEVKNSKLAGRKLGEEREYLKMVKMKECLKGVFTSANLESSLL